MKKIVVTALILTLSTLSANAQMVASSDVKTSVAKILQTNYTKMVNGDVAESHLQILDANNFFNPDNGILTHITPSGDALPVDLSEILDGSGATETFLSEMADTIIGIFDGLF